MVLSSPSAPLHTLPLEDMDVDSPLSSVPDDELPDMLPDSTPSPDVTFGKGEHNVHMPPVAAAASEIKPRRSSRDTAVLLLRERPVPMHPKKSQKQKARREPLGSAANPIDLTETQRRVGDDMVEVINIADDDV